MTVLLAAAALLILAVGIRLGSLFRGYQAGMSRVSLMRLNLDAAAGDAVARRLVRHTQRPGRFSAAILAGTHLSVWLVVFSVALYLDLAHGVDWFWLTLLLAAIAAPIVFVTAVLVPRDLFERAPHRMLSHDARLFTWVARFLYLASIPLAAITRVVHHLTGAVQLHVDAAPEQGRAMPSTAGARQPGQLTEVQNRLVHGVMHATVELASGAMTPAGRVLGVADTATADEVLVHASRFGLTAVPVRRAAADGSWYGYVRVVDAAVTRRPLSTLIVAMPRLKLKTTKLDALLVLCEEDSVYGTVCDGERVLGIVHRHGLIEQLFRPQRSPVTSAPRWS